MRPLAELRALAEAAKGTSGLAWYNASADIALSREDVPADMDFIAALSPDVTRALLAEVEAGRALRAAFGEYIRDFGVQHLRVVVPTEDGEDHDCPEDDTCACEHVARINATFAAYDAAWAGAP